MRAGRFRCGRPVFPADLLVEAGVLAIVRLLPKVAAKPSPAEVGPEVAAEPPTRKRLGGVNTCRSAPSVGGLVKVVRAPERTCYPGRHGT